MKKKLVIQLIILQVLLGSNRGYGEKQIVNMLYEYFRSSKEAPVLIGHQFFKNSDEMVFQIDIQTDIKTVNEAILFSFEGINKLANIANTDFFHSILIIHFNQNALPAVAESNISCSKAYFIKIVCNSDSF